MVPPNNLGPGLAGKPVNETSYRGMIVSLMLDLKRYYSVLENYAVCIMIEKAPQNYLREFWSTAVAYDPFPSTDETEQRPLKEFLIKFLVLNRQRPLTLNFNTFCSLTGLDYKNAKYVAYPIPKVVKKELGKIAINPSYLDKTLVLKNSFPVASRILFTFVIQEHTTDPKDSGESIRGGPADKGLPSQRLLRRHAKTLVASEGTLGNKDLGGNKPPPLIWNQSHPTIVDPSGTSAKYQVDQTQSTRLRFLAFLLSDDEAQESEDAILGAGDEIDEDS
ncbi:hypothetical protein Tco_0740340 [Tanacetum coccineum]